MGNLSLSIFADESGGQNGTSKYYLLTLVFHDQSKPIETLLSEYNQSLKTKNLPNIPFHASPLIYGKKDYKNVELAVRKQLFSSFFILVRKLPIRYKTFAYRRSELKDSTNFVAKLKRDLAVFLVDNLEYFQAFDHLKIYYDNGQQTITEALHGAIEYALSRNSIIYKETHPQDYRLSQAADFLCTIELTAIKYCNHDETNTDKKMFGNITKFKKGYLRHLRTKRLR